MKNQVINMMLNDEENKALLDAVSKHQVTEGDYFKIKNAFEITDRVSHPKIYDAVAEWLERYKPVFEKVE